MALELEELQKEQAGYEQQIQAVDEAMKAIQEQIDSMACTVSQNKVGKVVSLFSIGNTCVLVSFLPLEVHRSEFSSSKPLTAPNSRHDVGVQLR